MCWWERSGNAGLIFRVSKPDIGADAYCGYYVGINARNSQVLLGFADNSWHELARAPMTFVANTFYHLKVQAVGPRLRIFVNGSDKPAIDISDNHFQWHARSA